MPRQAITVKTIEGLRPKSAQYEVAEKGGLRIRVYPSGRMAYAYRYRDAAGRQRVLTLGDVKRGSAKGLTLTEARDRLTTAQAQRKQGDDPADLAAEEKAKQRKGYRERATAPTVADILGEYMTRHVVPKRRPTTQTEFRRLIDKELAPRIGKVKAGEATRTEIVAALDEIADKATPSIADHAANVLRSAFVFAVKRGRLEANPAQALPRYASQTSRERTLTVAEIRAFWKATEAHKGISEPVALALRLLLVTGQRRGSLAAAEWAEFKGDVWEIPAAHAKTGKAHVVPLSPLAQGIVSRLRELTGETQWVLPNPSITGPITPRALTRALARLRTGDYTVHDLRRTAATLMAKAGVTSFVVGRVLAHAYKSETGKYDRYEYQPEKRRALETLARKVGEIIEKPEAAKVVPLR